MKATLLIPTLNEVEGMKVILPKIRDEWFDQKIVADGGSTDGTIEYALQMGYEVIQQSYPGVIGAQRDAFPYIRGDIIISFSPDGNCLPEAIPEVIAKLEEGYDLVVASRYKDGLSSDDDFVMSRIGNRVITDLINLVFRAKYTDTLSIFRGYRTKDILELGMLHNQPFSIERWCSRYYCWDLMSSIRMAKAKRKIFEIAAREPARIGGVSKCQHYMAGVATLGLILNEWINWNPEPSVPTKIALPVEVPTNS